MLKQVTSSDKIRALAGFIEERKERTFDMSDPAHCVYAFARERFEYWERGGDENGNVGVLALLLQLPYNEAAAIYGATSLNREQIVERLRRMADEHESVEA